MKKHALFSIVFASILCSNMPLNKQAIVAKADSQDGYVEINDDVDVESRFSVVTHSPWATDTKLLISFTETEVGESEYLVLDYDTTLSKNNPELVARLGVNGNYFKGHDNEFFHGSTKNVMKNYGDWFFLPPGRNQLFLPVETFLLDSSNQKLENINEFDIFFDTGFENRSGSSIDIYGLYFANSFEETLSNNMIEASTYDADDTRITKIGINLDIISDQNAGEIQGAWLNGDYVGALQMHVKGNDEGGTRIAAPEDEYGFITITLNESIDISNDEGFAFSVFAPDGETYFKIILEDNNGYYYMPIFSGSNKDGAGHYPMMTDGIVLSILHFFGALYMDNKENGTAYIPYDKFEGVDHMFGEDIPLPTTPIDNIKKIHIGMDMNYGLGRNLVINEFGTCDVETASINSILQLSEMSETEWNRERFAQSENITINGSDKHRNNLVITAIDEEHIPGAKEIVNTAELENAIDLAHSLNKSDYTVKSWNYFLEKLDDAENILQYSMLYEQSDCDKATTDLLIAIRKLEPNTTTNNNSRALIIVASSVGGGLVLIFGGLIIAGFIVGGSAFALFTGKRKNGGKKHEE